MPHTPLALPAPGTGISLRLALAITTLAFLAFAAALSVQISTELYDAFYIRCNETRFGYATIAKNTVCRDGRLRAHLEKERVLNCERAELEMSISTRSCAFHLLTSHTYAVVRASWIGEVARSLTTIWGTMSGWVALWLVFPIMGIVLYYIHVSDNGSTRRHALSLQSQETQMLQNQEMLESMGQHMLAIQSGQYRRPHTQGPRITEESRSAEYSEEEMFYSDDEIANAPTRLLSSAPVSHLHADEREHVQRNPVHLTSPVRTATRHRARKQ